jgi:hypothetical protein
MREYRLSFEVVLGSLLGVVAPRTRGQIIIFAFATMSTAAAIPVSSTAQHHHRQSSFTGGVFIPVGHAPPRREDSSRDYSQSASSSATTGATTTVPFGRMARRKDPLASCGGSDRPTTIISTTTTIAPTSTASPNLQNATAAANPSCHNSSSLPTNEDLGLCVKCGMQLYQIKTKKKGLFHTKTTEIKVPLSIPGQVERGQCLQCGTNTALNEADNAAAAAAASTSSHSSHSSSTHGNGGSGMAAHADDDVRVKRAPHHGASILPQPASSQALYEGSFNVYGERDGAGKMTWDNGDVYTGEFFNGNRHGHGTLAFCDGSEYVGEWECNVQHGVGTRRWANGDCYTGQYTNGKRTGEGRFYFTNGDMYIGMWINGVMEGAGRYYYASGQRFEGIFRHGKRQGKGKLQRTDGSLDIGVYCNDVRIGIGVRWSADRTLAWKMCDGLVKKKITIPEAVALDYDIDAAAQALDESNSNRVV